MKRLSRLLPIAAVLLTLVIPASAEGPEPARFTSRNRLVSFELFGANSTGPIIIILHGASGPDVPLYRGVAQLVASNNYTVFFLHYFDATDTHRGSPETYEAWEKAVSDLIQVCKHDDRWSDRKIAILGFSLGASVALAAGSQMLPVNAVAEWYGSLPDEFFYKLKGMPPLLILHGNRDDNIPVSNAEQIIALCEMKKFECESHIYADQAHGFLPPVYQDALKRTLDFFSRHLN